VFLVLGAGFIALVQVVVYVGAVAVLFLFGLMLTRAPIGREALDSQNRGLGSRWRGRCSCCWPH
jgi:NADH-quinone oxidoreductase subunit J